MLSAGLAQTFSWSQNGTVNPSTGENYYSVTSGNNAGGTNGILSLTSEQYALAYGAGNNASFMMSGGTLNLTNTHWAFLFGQHGTATIDIQGGTLNMTVTGTGDAHSFAFGNGNDNNGGGVGTVRMTQEGGTVNAMVCSSVPGLAFGRDGGDASFTLTGGNFITDATQVVFGSDPGVIGARKQGTGSLTFGAGKGVFRLTKASEITFGTGSRINFLKESRGALELCNGGTAGSTQNTFNAYVTAGHIQLDGATTSTNSFSMKSVGNEDIYTLVVPKSKKEKKQS